MKSRSTGPAAWIHRTLRVLACGLAAAWLPAPAAEPGIIDCHVHLWAISKADGVDWIKVHCKVSALYGRVEKQPAPRDIGFYRPILDLAFDSFGEDRLIFGSDWPVSQAGGDHASMLALTRAYFEPKGPAVCDKLFHRNATAFYAIPAAD